MGQIWELKKKKKNSDRAAEITDLQELAIHSLVYEKRHFVLC